MAIDAEYRPRNPEDNPVYVVVAGHLETFLARQRERDRPIPGFVENEFREFLNCGVWDRGFLRVAGGEWQTPPLILSTAYFRESPSASGS